MPQTNTTSALFHAGEVAVQSEAGVVERMARLGQQAIRGYMPEQHRAFFPLLPFVIVGSLDARGQPTASLLAAAPGFVYAPEPTILRVDTLPLPGDPLERNLAVGAPLGVLGIQPHTRRRNRANGRVIARDAAGFALQVSQSFGNCPKYIEAREAFYVGASAPQTPQVCERLGERERAIVAAADTFFLASAHPDAASSRARAEGVDVSHRGGPAGFASFIDDVSFVISDYRGNNLYMTLGNVRLNPAVGLLFIDRSHGDLLQIDARADATVAAHPQPGPHDTGRLVRFRVLGARYFARASRLGFGPPTALVKEPIQSPAGSVPGGSGL
jgi:uncharacterized protein